MNDLLGNDFNPMAPEELHDKGPWTVSEDGRVIESDDFTHDVILRVTGDFYSDEQRKEYAENLAAKLNVPERADNQCGNKRKAKPESGYSASG